MRKRKDEMRTEKLWRHVSIKTIISEPSDTKLTNTLHSTAGTLNISTCQRIDSNSSLWFRLALKNIIHVLLKHLSVGFDYA